MSLRTPLGRALGLGAAKEGVAHWWGQRLTAVALVPLTFLFVVVLLASIGSDRAGIVALMGNPLVALTMVLFIVAGFYHMKLGVQVVIEDYIHHEGLKTVSLMALSLFSFGLGTTCLFAVLKLALGG